VPADPDYIGDEDVSNEDGWKEMIAEEIRCINSSRMVDDDDRFIGGGEVGPDGENGEEEEVEFRPRQMTLILFQSIL
jgi:hypothetical protein